jgi:hypothetical protein
MAVLTPRTLTAFLVPEVTAGTPVLPATATDTIQLREGLSFPTQRTTTTALREVAQTASTTGLIRNLRDAGSVTIPTYLRPHGTAGSKPQEDRLWAALFGAGVVVGGTSVTYKPAIAKSPHTLWLRLDTGAVMFCSGLYVNGLTLRQGEDGPVEAEWRAGFLKLGWCGSDTLAAAVDGTPAPAATCTVHDSAQFAVGAFIQIGTDHNSNAGYRITAINYSTHVLTVTPSISTDQAEDAAVVPLLPTATAVGTPLDTRPTVKIDNVAVYWKSWEIGVDEPISVLKEVTSDPTLADYPTAFGRSGARTVTGKLGAVLRSDELNRLRAVDTDRSFIVDFTQEAAGSRVTLTLAQGRWNVPELSAGDPALELTMDFEAKASASLEDELAAAYV